MLPLCVYARRPCTVNPKTLAQLFCPKSSSCERLGSLPALLRRWRERDELIPLCMSRCWSPFDVEELNGLADDGRRVCEMVQTFTHFPKYSPTRFLCILPRLPCINDAPPALDVMWKTNSPKDEENFSVVAKGRKRTYGDGEPRVVRH